LTARNESYQTVCDSLDIPSVSTDGQEISAVTLWPCNTGRATACVWPLRVLAWDCLVLCAATWWQVHPTAAALNVPP